VALDFNDYPFLTGPPEYRIYEIAHLCPLGLPNGHHFEDCGGYCVNMLFGLDHQERENGVYEVYVDSCEEPAAACLSTEDRRVAEAFVAWVEVGCASTVSETPR
jgi:hypothetical protein